MSSFLRRILGRKPTLLPLLGRWCHPSYSRVCDWERKVDLANMDNSTTDPPPRTKTRAPCKERVRMMLLV